MAGSGRLNHLILRESSKWCRHGRDSLRGVYTLIQDVDLERCRILFSRYLDDELLDSDDYVYEALWNFVTDHGHPVFVLEWDSGGPGGGAGTESVHSFQDFYFTTSVDFAFAGPFDTLEEGLKHLGVLSKNGRIRVNDATREIRCRAWTDEELIKRLDLESFDLPEALALNDRGWTAEELRRERDRLESG